MAKFSKIKGGKEVGQAEVYAKPHTMKGEKVDVKRAISVKEDPNKLVSKDIKPGQPARRVSAGDPNRDDVKKSGIKVRGTGAATKGLMARGPMA